MLTALLRWSKYAFHALKYFGIMLTALLSIFIKVENWLAGYNFEKQKYLQMPKWIFLNASFLQFFKESPGNLYPLLASPARLRERIQGFVDLNYEIRFVVLSHKHKMNHFSCNYLIFSQKKIFWECMNFMLIIGAGEEGGDLSNQPWAKSRAVTTLLKLEKSFLWKRWRSNKSIIMRWNICWSQFCSMSSRFSAPISYPL